jgi:Tfp pilus assembly protein PilV
MIDTAEAKTLLREKEILLGFTIIEVVCSIFVLGLALVSIIGMFSMGNNIGIFTEEKLIAFTLLEEKMEELKSTSFDDLEAESRTTIFDFPDYEIEVNITDVNSNPNLKDIRVTIYWTGVFNKEMNEMLATLISRHDRSQVESD